MSFQLLIDTHGTSSIPGSDDVAEPDAARRVGAELDECDFVGGYEDPAALLGGKREHRLAPGRGKRRRQVPL